APVCRAGAAELQQCPEGEFHLRFHAHRPHDPAAWRARDHIIQQLASQLVNIDDPKLYPRRPESAGGESVASEELVVGSEVWSRLIANRCLPDMRESGMASDWTREVEKRAPERLEPIMRLVNDLS